MHKLEKITDQLKHLQNYVKLASSRRGFDNETVSEKMMLLTEELGELCKAVRKNATAVGSDVNSRHHKVEEEAADVLYVLLDVCNKLQIDAGQSFLKKESINDKRNWE